MEEQLYIPFEPTREDRVLEFLNSAKGVPDIQLAINCFVEESTELMDSIKQWFDDDNDENRAAMVKEWADVQYVLSQLALTLRIDGEEAFRRVADSNMSKVVNGRVMYRDDGKILKGPTYSPPVMIGL